MRCWRRSLLTRSLLHGRPAELSGSVTRDRVDGQGPPVQKGEGAAGAGDRSRRSLPVLTVDEHGFDPSHVSMSGRPLVAATTAARRGPPCETWRVALRFRCASATCPYVRDRHPHQCGCTSGPEASLTDRCVRRWVQPAAHLFKPHPVLSLPKGS